MNFLKNYGIPGVVGLIIAIIVTNWFEPPSNAQRLVIFAVTYLVSTTLARLVVRLVRGPAPPNDDT